MPFGTVTLEGVEFPAPRDVEAFLAYTYGPGWRVPDPAFHFEHPAEHTRMMSAVVARHPHPAGALAVLLHLRRGRPGCPPEPSPASPAWVAARIAARAAGSSSSARAPAATRSGWPTRGSRSPAPTTAAPRASWPRRRPTRRKKHGKTPVRFKAYNLESPYNLLTNGARLAHEPGPKHVYARLLLDALAPPARAGLWRFCSMVGRSRRAHVPGVPHRRQPGPRDVLRTARSAPTPTPTRSPPRSRRTAGTSSTGSRAPTSRRWARRTP